MSIIQDQPTIHGKQNIYSKPKSVCATLMKYTGSNSKITIPKRQQNDAGVLQVW